VWRVPDNPAEIAQVALLAAWLALATVVQFVSQRHYHRLRRFPIVLCLTPIWRMFGPQPPAVDYHLLSRLSIMGKPTGPWTEVPIAGGNHAHKALWNPWRYWEKTLTTCLVLVLEDEMRTRQPTSSRAYRQLARLVRARYTALKDANATVQFLIVQSHGTLSSDPPDVLFLSNEHAVEVQPYE
jgi:hypothetical protein